MKEKKVSIIIPLPAFNDYIREAITHYESMDYDNYEIIILPDEAQDEILSETLPIRIIVSGKVGPAEKRDMGAAAATGEILAFIDDDAYPTPGWLRNAIHYFEDKKIGAVGGPAVTPPNEPFWLRVSGNIFASRMMSGHYRRRYVATQKVVEDYDIPSVNLIVRKKIFDDIGGFDSTFYPGEDTKFCLELKRRGYLMFYDPEILVYHHRRKLFWKHFAQLTNYAKHRGYFVKKYPETSRKVSYFIPTLFLLGVIIGPVLAVFSLPLRIVYFGTLGLYTVLTLIFSFNRNIGEMLMTFIGTFLSHIAYGFYFLVGLFTRSIKR